MTSKNKKLITLGLAIFFILTVRMYPYNESFDSYIQEEKKVDIENKLLNPFLSKSIVINNTWDSGAYDYCKDVAADSFGNIYLVGSTSISGNYDIIITKFNSTGHYLWNSTYGGSDDEYGYGIEIDSSNNIYIVGYTNSSYGNGENDIIFLKCNISGDFKWNKTWGGINHDFGSGITIDRFDDIYISGIYDYSFSTPDSGAMCLIKYNSSGIEQWNQIWDSISTDLAYEVAIDSFDNIYLGGVTNFVGLESGVSDTCLVKYNSSGDYQWNRTVDYNNEDVIFSIAIDSLNNIYLGGYTDSFGAGTYDMLLIKYNNSGGLRWNESWGGTLGDKCQDIAIDSFDNIYLTGYTLSYGVPSYESLCLIKYSSAGRQEWNWSMDASRQIFGEGIKIDLSNNIYLSGEDTGDMLLLKILPKPDTFNLSSDAEDLDPDGKFNLNWTESDDALNYSIYQYSSYISVINDSLTLLVNQTNDLSIALSDYSNGIYYFRAVAYNKYGNSTSNCINVTVAIPPVPPSSFDLSSNAGTPDDDGDFTLTWTSSTGANNYSIYQYSSYISVINDSLTLLVNQTNDLSIALSDYSNGIYYFRAVAYNKYGNSTSNCINVTVAIPPVPPSSFDLSSNAGTPDDDGDFTLTWTSSTGANNYSIYQYSSYISVINDSLTLLVNQTNDLSIALSDYSNGIYYFRAVAYNKYGNSTSNCIQITIQISRDISNDNNFITMLIITFSIIGIGIIATILIIKYKIQRK
ncbi:MAG: SBBP repeat-containing protein [Promethearchaeota archaeon]